MKFLKNITWLLFIVLTDLSLDASMIRHQNSANSAHQFAYKKNIAHTDGQSAQRLVEESFITPELQWSVLSYLGSTEMVINRLTGQVQGLPNTEQLLKNIQLNLRDYITSAQKESMKNAAHALLEATDIALFVASIEAVYQPTYQAASKQLVAQLNIQKQNINKIISAINAIKTVDSSASSSYFAWIPSFGSSNNQQAAPMISDQRITFDPASPFVAIPADFMPTIIQTNNYKQMASTNAAQAANLLWKECFIAQQHHLKDSYVIDTIKINLQNPISAQNYIFTNFPNLYDQYSGQYPICQIAQQLATSKSQRYNLQAPLALEQQQAHQILLHIRQAIQTALYIANKKSSYNVGYLPTSWTASWLDSMVIELTKYDKQLALLCKDPLYGATQADIDLEQSWSTTAMIAGGLILVGTALALDHMYGFGIGSAVYTGVSSSASTAAGYVQNTASQLIPSSISNIFGLAPAEQPATNQPVPKEEAMQGPQLPTSQELANNTNAISKNQEAINEAMQQRAQAPSDYEKSKIDHKLEPLKKTNKLLLHERREIAQKLSAENNAEQTQAQTPPASTTTSWLPWGGKKTQPAATPQTRKSATKKITDKGSSTTADGKSGPTWADRGKQAWNGTQNVSNRVFALSGLALAAPQIASLAEQQGIIEKGSYDKLTGGNSKQINQAAMTAGVISGSISGGMHTINVANNAWQTWGTNDSSNKKTTYFPLFWDTIDLGKAATGVGGLAISTSLYAKNQLQGLISTQQELNQQAELQARQNNSAAPVTPQQISPEQIYGALNNIAQEAYAEKQDSSNAKKVIWSNIQVIVDKQMTDPQILFDILNTMESDPSNQNIAQVIGEIKEELIASVQQEQDAQ